ncbi:MAG: hypothetical protein EOP06_02620 [Proteobacteria bacterium]|nr:MAG: hypothetical protein EOP06_02620 [Pseudomonadota bacterium]
MKNDLRSMNKKKADRIQAKALKDGKPLSRSEALNQAASEMKFSNLFELQQEAKKKAVTNFPKATVPETLKSEQYLRLRQRILFTSVGLKDEEGEEVVYNLSESRAIQDVIKTYNPAGISPEKIKEEEFLKLLFFKKYKARRVCLTLKDLILLGLSIDVKGGLVEGSEQASKLLKIVEKSENIILYEENPKASFPSYEEHLRFVFEKLLADSLITQSEHTMLTEIKNKLNYHSDYDEITEEYSDEFEQAYREQIRDDIEDAREHDVNNYTLLSTSETERIYAKACNFYFSPYSVQVPRVLADRMYDAFPKILSMTNVGKGISRVFDSRFKEDKYNRSFWEWKDHVHLFVAILFTRLLNETKY